MNEQQAIAIMLANLKGPKIKPSKTSEFAAACRLLKNSDEWGFAKMTEFFEVSGTMLREIDRLNELKPEFKKLADERKLGIGAAYQLTRIDESKQHEAARLLQGMNTTEVRNFVFYLTHGRASVDEAKKMADKLKTPVVTILALPISDALKARLELAAKTKQQTIHGYAVELLETHA